MKWLKGVIAIATIAFGCQGALGQSRGEIGMVGYFLGDGPWASWNGQWMALSYRNGGFELEKVTVTSTRDEKAICADFGFSIKTAPEVDSVLLLRGFKFIKPGPVTTGFHDRKFLHPGESLTGSLDGKDHWSLTAFGTVRPPLYDLQYTDYEVVMTAGNRQGTVFSLEHLDGDGLPEILWVGDVDGDRIADVFANVRTHYAGSHFALFLSSLARTGIVAEAGSIHIPGC